MAQVTEHDSEEEREGDDGEEAWVDFLVGCNSVRINNALEALGELIGAVERRWLLAGTNLNENGRDVGTCFLRRVLKRSLDASDIASGAPALSYKRLLARVVTEQVECLINDPLLEHRVFPAGDALSNGFKFKTTSTLGIGECHANILEPICDVLNSIATFVGTSVDGVNSRTHGLSDLANLAQQNITMSEDDEHILARLRERHRVDERLLDVGVVHVEVAAENTPKDPLKGWETGTVDGARNELEVDVTASRRCNVLTVFVGQERCGTIVE